MPAKVPLAAFKTAPIEVTSNDSLYHIDHGSLLVGLLVDLGRDGDCCPDPFRASSIVRKGRIQQSIRKGVSSGQGGSLKPSLLDQVTTVGVGFL